MGVRMVIGKVIDLGIGMMIGLVIDMAIGLMIGRNWWWPIVGMQ